MLRSRDREVYRPWKIPLSIKVRDADNKVIELPVIGLLGLIGTAAIWALVVLLHPAGRFFGFLWVAAGLVTYTAFRKLSRRKILSREERGLVVPAGYRMRVAILVRPFEDPDTIRKSVLRALDKRFHLKLLSIIDLPEKISNNHAHRVEFMRRGVEETLSQLAKELRSLGYDVEYDVKQGDFANLLEEEIEKGDIDFVAYIVRGFGKAALEKGLDEKVHSIMRRHPGKIMLLKRVTE